MLANHVFRKPVPGFLSTVVCHGEYTRFTSKVLGLTKIACYAGQDCTKAMPATVNLTGKLPALVLQGDFVVYAALTFGFTVLFDVILYYIAIYNVKLRMNGVSHQKNFVA